MRFGFIQTEKAMYPVRLLCRTLAVSRPGFYAWCRRGLSLRAQEDAALKVDIRALHAASGKTYGSPRIHADLKADDHRVGRKRVARLMQEEGIEGQRKRRFRVTTDSRHTHPVAPNELKRNFTTSAPNKVWVTDITYIWTREGWLYLAAILDLFSRRVVGWSMDSYHRSERWPSTPWAWPCGPGAPRRVSSITPTAAFSTRARTTRSQLRDPRHDLQHEPQGGLLGQRRRRELLLDAQGRARPPNRLREPQPSSGFGLRIHRRSSTTAGGVIQPSATSVRSSLKLQRPDTGIR